MGARRRKENKKISNNLFFGWDGKDQYGNYYSWYLGIEEEEELFEELLKESGDSGGADEREYHSEYPFDELVPENDWDEFELDKCSDWEDTHWDEVDNDQEENDGNNQDLCDFSSSMVDIELDACHGHDDDYVSSNSKLEEELLDVHEKTMEKGDTFLINRYDTRKFMKEIEDGADVNARNSDEWTPIFFAVAYLDDDLANFLIEKGADINAKDNINSTLLHIATYFCNISYSLFLVEKGFDINAKDKDGKTPQDFALNNGFDLIKMDLI